MSANIYQDFIMGGQHAEHLRQLQTVKDVITPFHKGETVPGVLGRDGGLFALPSKALPAQSLATWARFPLQPRPWLQANFFTELSLKGLFTSPRIRQTFTNMGESKWIPVWECSNYLSAGELDEIKLTPQVTYFILFCLKENEQAGILQAVSTMTWECHKAS